MMMAAEDSDIITLDSDDEADGQMRRRTGGAKSMRFDPSNYLDLMQKQALASVKAGRLMGMAIPQMPKGLPQLPSGRKFPKRPGVFPPFALFTQEHREKLMAEHRDLSFADVGRTLGEMWHKLTDDVKEDYRNRAKIITDQKLKDWQEQVKKLPPIQQQQIQRMHGSGSAPGLNPNIKRRRTHGYAIFSSEMRKNISDSIPLTETTRVIAERWRNADAATRQEFEAKAALINEQEARRYHNVLLQNQRRQQNFQMQQQRLQVLQRQAMGATAGPMTMAQRLRNNESSSGLKISSVSSLKSSPNVNLPSSITISRVDGVGGNGTNAAGARENNRLKQIQMAAQQKLPSGAVLNRGGLRPPPALKRGGGIPSNARSRLASQMIANSTSAMRSHQLQMLRQQQLMQNGTYMQATGGMATSASGALKRMAGMHHVDGPTPKKIRGGLPPSAPRICRVCCQSNISNFRLADRPDVITALESTVGLCVNPIKDKQAGLPTVICRKCLGTVITFEQFKKTVDNGQKRMRTVLEKRRQRQLNESHQKHSGISVSPSTGDESSSTVDPPSILPDVDDNLVVPQPVNIKTEKVEVCAKKIKGEKPDNETEEAANNENGDHGNGTDPLMFIQVGNVESNYTDFETMDSSDGNSNSLHMDEDSQGVSEDGARSFQDHDDNSNNAYDDYDDALPLSLLEPECQVTEEGEELETTDKDNEGHDNDEGKNGASNEGGDDPQKEEDLPRTEEETDTMDNEHKEVESDQVSEEENDNGHKEEGSENNEQDKDGNNTDEHNSDGGESLAKNDENVADDAISTGEDAVRAEEEDIQNEMEDMDELPADVEAPLSD